MQTSSWWQMENTPLLAAPNLLPGMLTVHLMGDQRQPLQRRSAPWDAEDALLLVLVRAVQKAVCGHNHMDRRTRDFWTRTLLKLQVIIAQKRRRTCSSMWKATGGETDNPHMNVQDSLPPRSTSFIVYSIWNQNGGCRIPVKNSIILWKSSWGQINKIPCQSKEHMLIIGASRFYTFVNNCNTFYYPYCVFYVLSLRKNNLAYI